MNAYDKLDELSFAPKYGLWPGVAAVTHDGAIYCVDCAVDDDDIPITMEMVKHGGEEYDRLPWTAVVLSTSEWVDDVAYCDRGTACVHSDGTEHVPLDLNYYFTEEEC